MQGRGLPGAATCLRIRATLSRLEKRIKGMLLMNDTSEIAGEGEYLYRPFCVCRGLSKVDVSLTGGVRKAGMPQNHLLNWRGIRQPAGTIWGPARQAGCCRPCNALLPIRSTIKWSICMGLKHAVREALLDEVYHSSNPSETLVHAGFMREHLKQILTCKSLENDG